MTTRIACARRTGRILLLAAVLAALAAPALAADDAWAPAMKEVHSRFQGKPGTLAHFGDSITVSKAYWFGLQFARKNAPPEMEKAFKTVQGHMLKECWDWRGPEFGNEGQKTIRWADQNVARWLGKLNPEAAVMMFGTNDLNDLGVREYRDKTRGVVQKCLDNGTIVILSTIPPRHGRADKAAEFAAAVRKLAAELRVPLIDYHAEILKRRPNDWDGADARFADYQGYDVPTLLSRDGVHPSNPKQYANDYSEAGLRSNGFALRSYLTLMKYAEVIERVGLNDRPAKDRKND